MNTSFNRKTGLALAAFAAVMTMGIASLAQADEAPAQPAEQVSGAHVVGPPKGAVMRIQNSHAILYDYKMEFGPDGRIIEERDHPTYMEAVMLGGIENHCTRRANEVEGHFQERVKSGIRFTIQGLLGAVGTYLGAPGIGWTHAFELNEGAALGGSQAVTSATWAQMKSIVYSYCIIQQVGANKADSHDGRLRKILPVPVVIGNGVRKASDPSDGKAFVPLAKNSDDNGYLSPDLAPVF